MALMPSVPAMAQTPQDHQPDHDHPLAGRQLALKESTDLPNGILFLGLESFSTSDAARTSGGQDCA